MSVAEQFPFADVNLGRRLEHTEARANVDFVEARAKAFPEMGATWQEIAGTFAMYDGRTSPVTQTFGMGMFQPLTAAELDQVEQFFRERRAPVCHEVSPLADASVLSLFQERGYKPIEFTSILYRPISSDAALPVSISEKISVRLAEAGEQQKWAEVAFQGWSELGEHAEFIKDLGQVNANRANGLAFFAELEGRPIATGLMSISDGVALLAGASTIPEGRKQGAQLALLAKRLQYAAEQGCDIAMMGALPGSASQRNAERRGFRIAYTRVKWQL